MQALMDQKKMEFYEEIPKRFVSVVLGEEGSNSLALEGIKPLIIYVEQLRPMVSRIFETLLPTLTIEVPSLFPYKSDKTIP